MMTEQKPIYILRCAMCHKNIGKGNTKQAALSHAEAQGARRVPTLTDEGKQAQTVICCDCDKATPTARYFGLAG
jgi:cytochrome c